MKIIKCILNISCDEFYTLGHVELIDISLGLSFLDLWPRDVIISLSR